MEGPIYVKYATSAAVPMALFNTSATSLAETAVLSAGDVTVSIDFGAVQNIDTLPVDVGEYFKVTLTSAETSGSNVMIHFKDQTDPYEWLEDYLFVQTYGNDNAHMVFDLSQATQNVNVEQVNGSTSAAENMKLAAEQMIELTVTSASFTPTTTQFEVTGTGEITNDHFKDRVVYFLTGNLAKQAKQVTGYDGSNKRFTVGTLTEAPSNGDTLLLV